MEAKELKGRANKGSKFWIQTLVNLDGGRSLTKSIQEESREIGAIKWLSPLKKKQYQEYQITEILSEEELDLHQWPEKGPKWDGVGIDDRRKIILIEAKGHPGETIARCAALSENSLTLIKESLQNTHDRLNPNHPYQQGVWMDEYYQLANRLTFLRLLEEAKIDARLILLNFVNDPTHKATSSIQWQKHYSDLFTKMTGTSKPPKNVVMVNYDVG